MTEPSAGSDHGPGPTPFSDRPRSPVPFLRISPLLALGQAVIALFWHLNLVEYWKAAWIALAGTWLGPHMARSFAIDSYMLLKWTILITLIVARVDAAWGHAVAAYMIASALFSYFYYHVWRPPPAKDTHEFQLRRTITFLFSFAFGIIAFAYLFLYRYRDAVEWPTDAPRFMDALLMSVSNAFTASFAQYPVEGMGIRLALMSEVIFVFMFVVIIIVNSVPSRG